MKNSLLFNDLNGIVIHKPSFQQKKEETWQEILLLLGTLGAGKTTLMQNIAEYLTQKGQSFEIIVNDIGNFNIDAERLAKYNPTALTQGCICCADLWSLQTTLAELKKTGKKILIEPSGIATGQEIKRVASELGMWSHVITLVNAEAIPLMDSAQKATAKTQIQLADVIGITHLSKDHMFNEEARSYAASINSQVPIFELQAPNSAENISKDADLDITPQLLEKQHRQPHFAYAKAGEKIDAHASFHTKSVNLGSHFGLDDLQEIVNQLGNQLIRAKGTIAIQGQIFSFDYVQNQDHKITIGSPSTATPHLNLISSSVLDPFVLEKMTNQTQQSETLDTTPVSPVPEEKIYSPIQVAAKVQNLLKQYADYMRMYAEKEHLQAEYQETPSTEIALKIESLALALDQLGDDMKFDNPLVRMSYKRLAYQNNPEKKVDTIGSLLKHCEKKTDICYKRLDFLNQKLKSEFAIDLFDEKKVNPDLHLVDFLKENDFIQKLCADEEFMQTWLEYEYFQLQGKVAKWQNYTPEEN